jgi:hypothetical protein
MFDFLIHTHLDYIEPFTMCMGQLNLYCPDINKYVLINKKIESKPEFVQIEYDDNTNYSQRFKNITDKILNDYILYLHEDMILYDKPNIESLKNLCDIMEKNNIDCIKLCANTDVTEEIYKNLRKQGGFYAFSVQPSLWNKKSFIKFMSHFNYSIQDMELKTQEFFKINYSSFVYYEGNEIKKGLGHYECNIFPYTATGIVGGKWNMKEYEKELKLLMSKYCINSNRPIMV